MARDTEPLIHSGWNGQLNESIQMSGLVWKFERYRLHPVGKYGWLNTDGLPSARLSVWQCEFCSGERVNGRIQRLVFAWLASNDVRMLLFCQARQTDAQTVEVSPTLITLILRVPELSRPGSAVPQGFTRIVSAGIERRGPVSFSQSKADIVQWGQWDASDMSFPAAH